MPVPREPNITEVHKFRPISVLSTCSKIMDYVTAKHICEHLETHGFFYKHQHSFRKGLSSIIELLEFISDLAASLDNTGHMDVIFFFTWRKHLTRHPITEKLD